MQQVETTRPVVGDIDLVEARVHLAAAQYHSSLANGKLLPRPPDAPRVRPASAGARPAQQETRLARPWSAQTVRSNSQHGVVRDLRASRESAAAMESATEALAVLMGPWGACCYSDAPPGVITSTLHDIADMLKIAANHRTRRKNLVKTSRMKFLPRSQESVERLHASIIGRSLGRSFANVLLLTRVLMAFKEALHHSCIEAVLKHRTGRLRAEVAAPDLAAAERSFRAWRSVTMLCQSHRAMESEIVRGRAALMNVWSKGREDLGRAVDRLSARLLVETLELSFLSWRDAVRLSNLESHANHLCSQRQRTPAVLQRVALLADEAFLLSCLVCWAGSCALLRQGRLHKDTETRLAEALCSAASLSIQLQREGANKLRLQSAALGYMRRSVQVERRWLQQAALRGWLRVSKAARASRRAASRAAIREQRRRCGDVWQAWRSWLHSSRRRHYSHVQGQRVVSRTVQSEILTCWHGWQEVLTKRKAEDKSARLRSLRWNTSDQRLARAKRQLLRDCLAGWAKECREASMRKARKRQAETQCLAMAAANGIIVMLQSFGSWRQFVEEGKAAQTLEQAQASKSSAVDQALQQAMMALERCQEQPGPFHCQLLSAWWGLILQRKSRERQKQQAMQMALARENSAEDSLVACCFSGWRRAQEAWCRQRAQEEAVADARAMTHLKTLDALRRRADAEGETLLLFHFLAWLRSLLHCKVEKARKEKAMTSAFGQLMLDDEMMRSRCFSEWRQAVHDSHREAVKAAMEREAEDRMREAQEQKLQVMRQAFRSSDEALLGSVVLAWHHTSRTAKRRSAAHTAGEALHTRQQAERSSFFVARAVAAWHLAASRAVAARGARARRRSAVGEVLDTWLCRALQRGVDSAELRSFQVLLLDSWQQAATTLRRAKSRLPGSRARADQIGKELRLGLVCHTWGAWRRLGAAAPKRRGWERAEEKAKSLHEDLRRWALEGWHIFAVSARGERRVATACARARELQVGARRQKLVLVDFASTQCQLAALCILLLRWALVARSYRLSSRLKEWGHVAASRHAARQEAQLLHICLAAFAAEVSEARRGRIYTDMTCQIHAAVADCDQFFQRLVLKRCQAGRVVSRLQSAAQLRHLRSTFAAWSCVLYRRRRLRESMAKLSTHLEAAAAAELMAVALAGWSWKAKEEKATRRGVRSLARGSKVILRLRRQLLLLEAFRGWQHARCYEEVFQMLTASQADLANAAEAVALAEAAAAAAARSQQVTVRVLPTPARPTSPLMQAPSTLKVVPLEHRVPSFKSGIFSAPLVSLQKDIERHYGQQDGLRGSRPPSRPQSRPQSANARRPCEFSETGGTGQAKECTFEAHCSEEDIGFGQFFPSTREAWRA